MNGRLDDAEKLFLSHLDADGTARGNKALREALPSTLSGGSGGQDENPER